MIFIPKGPVIQSNLNTYYLNIEKLIEHFQGELGAGSIYFQSHLAEGIIFFDKDEILNASLEIKDEKIEGSNAINRLIKLATEHNFIVKIYEVDIEQIYFWSNIANAKDIYKGLSAEFTDLESLIKKMSSENLTGYIDVLLHKGNENSHIFFNNGQIICGFYSWNKGQLDDSNTGWKKLVEKTKSSGGIFNVRSILMSNKSKKKDNPDSKAKTSQIQEIKSQPISSKQPSSSAISIQLEGLLDIFERVTKANKKVKKDFDTLLKKKFLEKVDKYPFLDPFSGDFQYSNKKITFNFAISDQSLLNAIFESTLELAKELEVLDSFLAMIKPWSQKYSIDLTNFIREA